MAILEDLGLEVKIVVNGSPLQEYEDKQESPTDDGFGDEIRKCRRYVEVLEDAEFAVQLHVTPNNEHLDKKKMKWLRFGLDLDGQEDLASLLVYSTKPETVEGKLEQDGERCVLRKFRFTTVSTVDDDEAERVKKDKKTAGHLGLLRIRVWRVEASEARKPSAALSDSSVPIKSCQTAGVDEAETKLAEKAMKGKALSHRATLSAAVPGQGHTFHYSKYVGPKEVPLAIFYFKYRSKAVLQEELIIPRSREPSPVDVDLDGLPLREVRRLARESLDTLPLHEIRRLAQLRLLNGKEGSNVSQKGDVKREPGGDQISQRPRKLVKMGDGREAVDLTHDD